MTDRSLIALKRRAERGKLFVVSAPSGSGKSTLVRMLLKVEPACALSISYTTRAPRSTEQEGVDYYFISRETFDQMISDGAFVEWAEVHGNRYGTSFHEIERLLEAGHDVLFDIDYQGARALPKPRIADLIDDGDALTEWHRNMAKLRERHKV